MNNAEQLTISTPGRICLFGEHQDYLGLPVIAAAISLRLQISGTPRKDLHFNIDLPDIGGRDSFWGDQRLLYNKARDYFRSGFNILWDEGMRFSHGWDFEVHGNIPINSGTSSSSAMMVSWINFLLHACGHARAGDADYVARLAHRAEVLEFDEPGGMMDQISTSYGHVIFLDFSNHDIQQFAPRLGTFVLGDSQQPKDTMKILANTKNIALEAVELISKTYPKFNLRQTSSGEIENELSALPPRHREVLNANLIDRDLLREGLRVLQKDPVDRKQFGNLLSRHHEQLSRYKQVSTPKIERMLDAALAAGALGGKINGSGGGGCMFAYAPDAPEAVAEAIRGEGGLAYIVEIADGTKTITAE